MRILTSLFILLFTLQLSAQVYEQPNYSLTSHPTLDIISVERWEDQMVLTLSLKNERYSGTFCIDSNTVLRNSLGKDEYKLVSMEGIPACPEIYRFKSIGERKTIILEFNAIPDDVKYIDLIENCDDNCVSIYYILLDEELNSRLNEGIHLYELGKSNASLQVFQDLMKAEYDDFSPVFGTVYLYLISIHYEMGNSKDARDAFQALKESNIVGRDEFIETARETGIVR
ncbi:tetratricopeptide repeat protein [Bacteroidota bacterium]